MPLFPSFSNFVANTVIDSAAMNANFDIIENFLNVTKIDDSNIQDGGISASKLNAATLFQSVKVGDFAVPGTTGNYSETGLGFQPRVVLFVTMLADSGTGGSIGVGAVDENGNEWVAISATADTGDHHRETRTDVPVYMTNATGVVRVEGNYVSMDADGFTLDFTTVTAGSNVLYLALG